MVPDVIYPLRQSPRSEYRRVEIYFMSHICIDSRKRILRSEICNLQAGGRVGQFQRRWRDNTPSEPEQCKQKAGAQEKNERILFILEQIYMRVYEQHDGKT